MNQDELEHRAINEVVRIEPYNPEWAARFIEERTRIAALAPELIAIEHVGSTAVPLLAAKPIIDIMAAVASIETADILVERFCANVYITSVEFNRTLRDRRWLMRHAGGRRTHHLHLVVVGSSHWSDCIRFRDLLRQDSKVAGQYSALKRALADKYGNDRDGYGNAKAAFIAAQIAM